MLASIKSGIERARSEVQTARYAAPPHQRIASAAGQHTVGAIPALTMVAHDVTSGQSEN